MNCNKISVKGCGFDAASKVEIDSVSKLVPPERIIFAQTCKIAEHIEFARQKDVAMMTFDSISELQKIKRTYPNAKGKTHDFILREMPSFSTELTKVLNFSYPQNNSRRLEFKSKTIEKVRCRAILMGRISQRMSTA